MSPEPQRPSADLQQPQPHPSLSHAVPEALAGAVFPLSAEQLLLVARENEAPGALLTLLSTLPRRRFESLEAVAQLLQPAPR
jgi:hypothetical protein